MRSKLGKQSRFDPQLLRDVFALREAEDPRVVHLEGTAIESLSEVLNGRGRQLRELRFDDRRRELRVHVAENNRDANGGHLPGVLRVVPIATISAAERAPVRFVNGPNAAIRPVNDVTKSCA